MPQPTPYSRLYAFATYQANNPAAPYNGAQHDAEFNAVMATLTGVLSNLELLQQDDGELLFAVVTPDALNTATLNLMGDWAPKGPWLPDTAYAVRDMVTVSSTSYVCATAHTSDSFAIELSAGYWQPVNQSESGPPTSIQFTATDRILGRASPGAGQGEEIVCTSFGRSLIDDANAAEARITLGIGPADTLVTNGVVTNFLTLIGVAAFPSFLYIDAGHVVVSASASPTDGQLLIGDTGGNPTIGNITGAANQVIVTNGAGTIALSLPQNIGTLSTPNFATVNLTNLSKGSVVFVGDSSALTQDTTNFVWDATNKRLGVGTNAPSGTLELSGVGGGSPSLVFEKSGDTVTLDSVGGTLSISTDSGVATDIAEFNTDGSFSLLDRLFMGSTIGGWDVEIRREAAHVLSIRQDANAMTVRGYRTFTNSTNYERWALQSGAGYFELAAETAGTGTDDIDVRLTPAGVGELVSSKNFRVVGSLGITTAVGSVADVTLFRDAANILAQRNSTNAQAFRIYNTYTSGANFENASFSWSGNKFFIQTGTVGGTTRDLSVRAGTGANLFLGANNTDKWEIESGTGHLWAAVDNSFDIGASGATRPRNLYLGSSLKQIGGITTSGVVGAPAIVATGRSTAQAAAVASVSTFTVGAADASFEVSANVLVTTATTHAFTVTCAYTDEGNTARTLTMTFGLVAGGVTTTSIANANGTVPYMGVPLHIRCKTATTITIATTGTFTTVQYNVEGHIKQCA